ncbi:MAG: hypothetical protein R3A13_05075 [Bdellovibrionota bacterium]
MFNTEQLELLEIINSISEDLQIKVYIVGGVVRDLGMGVKPHDRDLDFIVEGDAISFAKRAASVLEGKLLSFPKFLTAKVIDLNQFKIIKEVDFASSRTEVYQSPGSLPSVTLATLEDDLRRRDFSVNALAVAVKDLISSEGLVNFGNLKHKLIDPFNGVEDLKQKKIRVLHAKSFLDDPTRLYRACRYAERIAGDLEDQTRQLFLTALQGDAIPTVSNYRLFKELQKILIENNSAAILQRAQALGLQQVYPNLAPSRFEYFTSDLSELEKLKPKLSPAAKFRLAMTLFCYYEVDSAEGVLHDGQLNKADRKEIIDAAEKLKQRTLNGEGVVRELLGLDLDL